MNYIFFCRTPVLGLGLEVDFTFAWDNNNNNNDKNPHQNILKGTVTITYDKKNPHLKFFIVTVLVDKGLRV